MEGYGRVHEVTIKEGNVREREGGRYKGKGNRVKW